MQHVYIQDHLGLQFLNNLDTMIYILYHVFYSTSLTRCYKRDGIHQIRHIWVINNGSFKINMQ